MPKQQRRTFTSEFKKQMVRHYENGKSRAAIVEEYDLMASALDQWIKQAQTTVRSKRRTIVHLKKMNHSAGPKKGRCPDFTCLRYSTG